MQPKDQAPRRAPDVAASAPNAGPGATLSAEVLVDAIRDYAVFMIDPAGVVLSWNPGAEHIHGYRPAEIIGRSFRVFYPPEVVAVGFCERELAVAAAEGRFEDEAWRVRKDGTRFWANVVLSAIRGPDGHLLGFAKVTRDLTERRRAEEVLHESEERFRLLVDSVQDYAIFMLDPSGRVLSWNPGAERIKGYRAEEIVGQSITRFYRPEEAGWRPRQLLDAAEREGRVEDVGWRVKKDGTLFWADVTISAMRDPTGTLRGFVKVTRDLTERRAADEALRESEERFRLLVDAVEDYAIFLLDPGGHILTWNLGAERINGFTSREIVGRHFSILYPEEDRAAGRPERELTICLDTGRYEEEGWRLRRDGTRFWAGVTLTLIRDADGRHRGFAKVTRDLTERRALEEERIRVAQAEEALRLRDEFLAVASHELRTPLTSLQLQIQSLQHRARGFDATTADRVARATRSAERLAGLIDALLDVSRIAAGHLEMHREPVDLGDVVADAVQDMRAAAEAAGCEVSVTVASGMVTEGDPLRLGQVVTNLVGNAIKYAPGTTIEVTLARDGGEAVLSVHDGGPGFPEAQLPRVFERFERAAPISHYGGLGLGLFVTREIIAAHGGHVTARNAPDGGALVEARLPVLVPTPSGPGLVDPQRG